MKGEEAEPGSEPGGKGKGGFDFSRFKKKRGSKRSKGRGKKGRKSGRK